MSLIEHVYPKCGMRCLKGLIMAHELGLQLVGLLALRCVIAINLLSPSLLDAHLLQRAVIAYDALLQIRGTGGQGCRAEEHQGRVSC